MKPKKKRKHIDTGDKKTSKKAKMSVQHDAAKQIFESEQIKCLREEIEQLKKAQEPQNPLVKVCHGYLILTLFYWYYVLLIGYQTIQTATTN